MPDVSCQVEWGEGVQPDQVIGDAAQAYFTLLGTALSAPEQPVQSDPSCTDALVQEAYLRGFMSSDLLYPHVELRVRINRLTFPTPETARAEIYLNCEVLSCLDISGRSNDESKQGFGDDHVVTLAETDAGWIVTGDDSEKSDISGQYCGGFATENPPEEDIRQAVEGYFQLRAGEVSGDMKNSDVTVPPCSTMPRSLPPSNGRQSATPYAAWRHGPPIMRRCVPPATPAPSRSWRYCG